MTAIPITADLVKACAISDMLLRMAGSDAPGTLRLIFPGDFQAASFAERVLVEEVTGRPVPERSRNSGIGGHGATMPVNVAYLRAELMRWAARTHPEPKWIDGHPPNFGQTGPSVCPCGCGEPDTETTA